MENDNNIIYILIEHGAWTCAFINLHLSLICPWPDIV